MADRSLPESVLAGREDCDKVAVLSRHGALSYRELAVRSAALAAAVGDAPLPDRPVAVLCTDGLDMVAAMLGVAWSGRAYLVLDPHAPPAFHAEVLARHSVGAVVADILHRRAALDLGPQVIPVEAPPRTITSPSWPAAGLPASVSMTSGTAGRPKAVVHAHRSIVHNAESYGRSVGITEDDVVLVSSPFSAVAAGTPTWTALVHGARLITADLSAEGPHTVLDRLADEGVTVAHLAPAALTALASADMPPLPGVRLVSLGGDRLTAAQIDRARALFPEATLLHRYSTSETNWIAGVRIPPGEPVPTDPIPLTEVVPWLTVRVVGPDGGDVGPEDVGEVVVSSEWLALGYLDDPERTAERFLDLPTGRSYRTGDRATWDVSGALILRGRSDDVVKVSGALVDPVQVEAVVRRVPGVDEAAVVIAVDQAGRPRPVAFVVGQDLRGWQVRAALADRLPRTHVPARVEVLDALPSTDRGKVDRAALTAMASATGRPAFSPPRSPFEQQAAEVFGSVLGDPAIGRDDDLLALGADSLALSEVCARLEAVWGRPVSEGLLLRHPTPALLAEAWVSAAPDRQRLVRAATGPSDAVPMVLFPGGGGGHTSGMATLARTIGGRTAWVAVPRGFDRRERPDRTIEAMATTAASDIVEVAGTGPVVLIGHSIGGTVAMQTARVLTTRGVTVPLVVLLDTLAVTEQVNRARRLRSDLRPALRQAEAVRAAQGKASSLTRKAFWAARLPMRRARRRWLALTAGVVARRGERQHAAFEALAKVASRNHEDGPYEGDVVLVRAVGAGGGRQDRSDLGWSAIPGVRLTQVVVEATHNGMIAGSAGLHTATAIREALDAMDDVTG
ncbi:MAG: alpha/beta fold hydrolase [Actinomycetales bacterium]|nr:alpha/beta fold hydrolase [Actinomycetales bacterium]